MLRIAPRRLTAARYPLCSKITLSSHTRLLRSYSTEPPSQKKDDKEEPKKEKSVNFRSFVTVGIFASIILTQVVEVVNQQKPRARSMSETEYFQQQARLKRKVSLFQPDEKEVYFLKSEHKIEKSQISAEGVTVIQPEDLVAEEKKNEESKFHALLNDPSLTTLPRGLVIELIGNFLGSHPNGKFVVLNFPSDINESRQFEDKIVTIKSLINVKNPDTPQDAVARYYKTVDKVQDVSSIDEARF